MSILESNVRVYLTECLNREDYENACEATKLLIEIKKQRLQLAEQVQRNLSSLECNQKTKVRKNRRTGKW